MSDFSPIGDFVFGPGCAASDYEQLCGCDCHDVPCTAAGGCACLAMAGDNYDADDRLINANDVCIVECGDDCACVSATCANRVIQRGVHAPLECVQTNKGIGVRCRVDLPPGTFVCQYIGELIDEHEWLRRQQTAQHARAAHEFTLRLVEMVDGGATRIQTIIDPTHKGNIGRFLNHSCAPNLHVVLARYTLDIARAAFFTNCTVRAGTELCYAYDNRAMRHDATTVPADASPKTCLCGAPNCTGVMPNDHAADAAAGL